MTSLTDVLEEVYKLDYAEFDNPPDHRFSRRSRKRLKEILYRKPTIGYQRSMRPCRRVAIALTIIALMLVGATAVAAVSGFVRKEHKDNTEILFAGNENSPKTIECVYYLPEIPDGYEFSEEVADKWDITTHYLNRVTNRKMVIRQTVKDGYKVHIDNEHHLLEEIEINGHRGLYLRSNNTELCSGSIIWDNMDYVLEISGDFDKSALQKMAKSMKIQD